MNMKISNSIDNTFDDNEIEILIKSSNKNESIPNLIEYIKGYNKKMLVNYNNTLVEVNYDDIICFYSDKKYNYCKTKNQIYKIKSKLYEVEKMDFNFIRISKSCIANISHIKCFDISESGRIIIVFDDYSKEFVSRRKIRSIMDFLEERMM